MPTYTVAGFLLGVGLLALMGCSGPQAPSKPGSASAASAEHSPSHAHDHAAADGASVKASLAKLSDTDRVVAEKQRVCPVSDEPLGAMGIPRKVTVKGQDVFLCCDDCKEALTKDPDQYLAKLKEHNGSHAHE